MVDFLRIKYEIQKLKQSEIANQLYYSFSTLQGYRNDISNAFTVHNSIK